MAKNLSAVKRVQIASRNNRRNKNYKSSIKTMIKAVFTQLSSMNHDQSDGDKKKLNLLVAQVYSKIDKAAKRRVIHKNSAARKKSRLANRLKAR